MKQEWKKRFQIHTHTTNQIGQAHFCIESFPILIRAIQGMLLVFFCFLPLATLAMDSIESCRSSQEGKYVLVHGGGHDFLVTDSNPHKKNRLASVQKLRRGAAVQSLGSGIFDPVGLRQMSTIAKLVLSQDDQFQFCRARIDSYPQFSSRNCAGGVNGCAKPEKPRYLLDGNIAIPGESGTNDKTGCEDANFLSDVCSSRLPSRSGG